MEGNRNCTIYNGERAAEQDIKRALRGSVEGIEASDDLKRRIDRLITEAPVKEKKMKHFNMKKILIGVAAACLIVGTVGIAGSGIKYYNSSTSNVTDYNKYEDLETVETKAGYDIRAVEEFGNGFRFEGIFLGDMNIENEAGQVEERMKDISIDYEKDGESITFFAHKLFQSEIADMAEMENRSYDQTLQVGDVRVGFDQFTNKFVPADYELTEEDKANMENPDFNLAYGTDKVEMSQGFSVSWVQNGIAYSLYGTDLSITGEEMLHMAKEIIESVN